MKLRMYFDTSVFSAYDDQILIGSIRQRTFGGDWMYSQRLPQN